ncbi:hypothetical protein TWF481_003855 [Arthrobotrys musiformis]|uniref:Uncharacterized protein n=1 Tax=Arthrobotrys musiformis TaxID=47236 RepID=A0AAV9WJE7_9PEZI
MKLAEEVKATARLVMTVELRRPSGMVGLVVEFVSQKLIPAAFESQQDDSFNRQTTEAGEDENDDMIISMVSSFGGWAAIEQLKVE